MRNPNPTIKPPFGSYIDPDHPLAKGLVGCWLFNEHCGRFVNDLSPYRNNGRIYGNVFWKEGLRFYGQAYVDCGNIGAIDNFAIVLRFYPTNFENYRNSFHTNFPASGTNNKGVRLEENTNGDLTLDVSADNTARVSTVAKGLVAYKWYHFVIVRNGDQLLAYLNNDKKMDINNTSWPSEFSRFNIGRGFSTEEQRSFKGLITGTLVYNRAPSPDEIEWSYTEPYCFIIWPGHRFIFDLGRFSGKVKM